MSHEYSNPHQLENTDAQGHVDLLTIRTHLLEAIGKLRKVREYFQNQRPSKGRNGAIAAADRAILNLEEHYAAIDKEIRPQ